MKKLILENNKGFSTLLIVILLGFVSLSLTLTLSTSTVWSIRGSIDSKNSTIARSLVNTCAEIALEAIRENNSFVGAANVLLNNNTCNYVITNTGGNTRLVSVSGTVLDVTRQLTISTSSFNPLLLSSWQESL